MGRRVEIVGKRFGGYEVLALLRYDRTAGGTRVAVYRVRCIGCGAELERRDSALRSNQGGCAACKRRADSAASAAGYKHPLHHTWWGMITRCHDAKSGGYAHYGARGITVCAAWRGGTSAAVLGTVAGFRRFLSDMGPRPPGTTLGRIDNDGPYSPENCRWETPEQQANNTRRNVRITVGAVTQTATQWGRALGRPPAPQAVARKYGVTPEFVVATWLQSADRRAVADALGVPRHRKTEEQKAATRAASRARASARMQDPGWQERQREAQQQLATACDAWWDFLVDLELSEDL